MATLLIALHYLIIVDEIMHESNLPGFNFFILHSPVQLQLREAPLYHNKFT